MQSNPEPHARKATPAIAARRKAWRRKTRVGRRDDGGVFLNLRLVLDLAVWPSMVIVAVFSIAATPSGQERHWLNLHAKLVTWGGARGDGRGGAGVCLQVGETSAGLNLAGECLGAHSVRSPIDLEVDLTWEERRPRRRRDDSLMSLMTISDGRTPRSREAGLELGLKAGAVFVDVTLEVESSIFDSTGNCTPLMTTSSALTSPPTASATAFWSSSAFDLSMESMFESPE